MRRGTLGVALLTFAACIGATCYVPTTWAWADGLDRPMGIERTDHVEFDLAWRVEQTYAFVPDDPEYTIVRRIDWSLLAGEMAAIVTCGVIAFLLVRWRYRSVGDGREETS